MSTVSLVIPSYGRPDQLARALASARHQARPFDEIVVVIRRDDDATARSLSGDSATVVMVDEPGVLAAMTAGARAATSSIIAFSDDDAELADDWCARVESLFEWPGHELVGGVGGRDVLYDGDRPRPTDLTDRVGELTWWGRLVGNHHRGSSIDREVVVLKGVNCAYRRVALAVPSGLRGRGAQAHFEVAIGRYALSHGWSLRFYGDLTVIHRPADRLGDDQRGAPSDEAIADSAFNLMRSLAPSHQHRRWVYVHLVGDRAAPGLARCVVAAVRGDRAILTRRAPSWRGTTEAWRLRRVPLEFTTFE